MNPFILQVLLNVDETYCAKCCRTRNIVERMIEEVPGLKDRIEVIFEDISTQGIRDKYGQLTPPVIIMNDSIYLEGHVPVIKKLSRAILDQLNS